jgi:uncharacterized protein (DUF362 family)
LRLAGGLGAAAGFAGACRFAGLTPHAAGATPSAAEAAPSTSTPLQPNAAPTVVSPTPTPEALAGRVALVRTSDRANGLRRAVGLLGVRTSPGAPVFVKPNFNSADPTPGSTHNDVLRAMVEQLRGWNAGHITVGDRSGMGDTGAVMRTKGVEDMAEALGFEAIVFDDLPPDDWVARDAPGSHWSRGFRIARACLESELVQLCCLKTHRYGGHFTLSLKNTVGMAAKRVSGDGHDYMTELHNSADQRRMIAELNVAYAPTLVVMDGVEAFTRGGPEVGALVEPGVVLAAVDRVAIDAVGVAILRDFGTTAEVQRGRVFEQEQIARAVELNLGVSSPDLIEFVTEDEAGRSYAQRLREILLTG